MEEEHQEDKADPDEKKFLESIDNEPFLSVAERRVKLGWNNRRYVQTADSLLKKKKIERMKVRMGKGSPKILYQIPGRVPAVKHEYYVNWIANYLKVKGFSCKKNSEGPDIEIPEIRMAIEVELGKSNMYGNIRSDSQKFDRVIICSDQKKVLDAFSAEIKDSNILFLQIQKIPAFFEKMSARKELEDC